MKVIFEFPGQVTVGSKGTWLVIQDSKIPCAHSPQLALHRGYQRSLAFSLKPQSFYSVLGAELGTEEPHQKGLTD